MDRLKQLLTEEAEEELSSTQDITGEENSEHEFIEVISYSIEEGLETASRKLNAGIADLEYEIIEKGSNGFLGIGKKPFNILVKRSLPQVSEELQELTSMTSKMSKGEIIQDMDGSYKVRVTKKGFMLTVKLPQAKGRRVSIEERKNELYQNQIQTVNDHMIQSV